MHSHYLTPLAVGAAVAAWAAWGLRRWVRASVPLAVLAGVNVATLCLYAWDKRAARRNQRRIPESVLHLAAIMGGSPAALLAQTALRHKTVKPHFRAITVAIFIVESIAAAGFLLMR